MAAPTAEPAVPEPAPTTVAATAGPGWPGTDVAEAIRISRGELGDPHLPFLPQLPDRGIGADAVGRTASLLVDLPVDLQPHGWRLVDRPGRDLARAQALLSRDLNTLADLAGEEDRPSTGLRLSLLGPLSLAAGLHLHNGERALVDAGARRELAESLAAGLGAYLRRAAEAVPGARLVLAVEEPDAERVLRGRIPTASGYRTLRAVPDAEARRTWQLIRDAAAEAGARTVLVLPGVGRPADRAAASAADLALAAGYDGVGLPAAGLQPRDWETVARTVEEGRRIELGLVPLPAPGAQVRQVTALVDSVLRPWRDVGLPLRQLPALAPVPAADLAAAPPATARAVLARLTQTASALEQVAADA